MVVLKRSCLLNTVCRWESATTDLHSVERSLKTSYKHTGHVCWPPFFHTLETHTEHRPVAAVSSSVPPSLPSVASPGLGEVTIVSVPQVRVVALRVVVENYRAQQYQWQQLHAFCKAHALALDGPSRTIYYDEGFKAADVDFEVCLALHADAKVPRPSDVSASDVQERVLPAIEKAASFTLVGPYEELPNAYRKLYAWRQSVGVAAAGPVREVYHHADHANDPTGASFVTELQLPIATP